MPHHIYYTSAPEGLKRGSSGFCTVAASDNIPKPLWDRLEALSAYRHHFPPGQQNPVSHAHWLLNVAGSTYHVLSRICDSGVDYTQRTNAFAHHLVLEPSEMSPAGPAWLLQRPGVMAHGWNGQVGSIPRPSIPGGNVESGICRAWASATGDAGWAGHLADTFVKAPSKPVCILFNPGQEVLPLIAEAIALLPPAVRWNVTFNTYFTSMPTSATCVWRCCLANTPAAQIGLRYAASGIVIDLTDPAKMGSVPPGPYVTLARTGLPPAGVVKTAATRPAAARARPAVKGPARTPEKPDEIDDLPESELYDLADEPALEPPPPPTTAASVPSKPVMPSMRQADAALRRAESDLSDAAARRRKQVMLLFGAALAALAFGSILVLIVMNTSRPPEVPPTVATGPRPEVTPPPPPVYIAPAPDETTPENPVVVVPQPASQGSEPATAIIIQEPANGRQTPGTTTIIPPAAPKFPETVTLDSVLEYPTAGAGIGDYRQTLKFRAVDLDPSARRSAFCLPSNAGSQEFDEPKGSLYQVSQTSQPHIATLVWRSSTDNIEVAQVTLDRNRATVHVEWRSAAMLKIPDVVRGAYWTLQRSWFKLLLPDDTTQRILFKPVEAPVISLAEPSSALFKGLQVPIDAAVDVVAAQLPAGWQVKWYTEWDVKDAALRTPQNASQVLKFSKPGPTAAIEAWFLLSFRPGFTKVESTFARRVAADEADLAKAESDLRAITADVAQYRREGKDDTALKPWLDKKDQIQKTVDGYKAAVAGYKELTELDVRLEWPRGVLLTTLHFRAKDK